MPSSCLTPTQSTRFVEEIVRRTGFGNKELHIQQWLDRNGIDNADAYFEHMSPDTLVDLVILSQIGLTLMPIVRLAQARTLMPSFASLHDPG